MRILLVVTVIFLSACSWLHSRKAQVPDPSEIIVTGASAGSIVFIDGAQAAEPTALNDHPQILTVTTGTHTVEIHVGDSIVYREETYVAPGEKRMVRVLSGFNR